MAKTTTAKPDMQAHISNSAHNIWLAGLGAFAKAQQEGGKVFDKLIKDGVHMQRETQKATEEKLHQATQTMGSLASEISQRATGQWDKLETIFEQRVAKALARLGMPSGAEVAALQARVAQLELALAATRPTAASPAKASRSTPVSGTTRSAKASLDAGQATSQRATRKSQSAAPKSASGKSTSGKLTSRPSRAIAKASPQAVPIAPAKAKAKAAAPARRVSSAAR